MATPPKPSAPSHQAPSGQTTSTNPHPNRRERKKHETRRLIRLAALDLFEKHGYDNVTVDDISHAADVSPVTVYRHFTNKEGIVISLPLTTSVDHAAAFLTGTATPRDVDVVLTTLFENAEVWAPSLKRRLTLIHGNAQLTAALWQRTTVWTDTLTKALPDTLSDSLTHRMLARCLVGALVECALDWASNDLGANTASADAASLRTRVEQALTLLQPAVSHTN